MWFTKDMPPVAPLSTITNESDDTIRRNQAIKFVLDAYKEEDVMQDLARNADYPEDMVYYENQNVCIVDRNDFLFSEQLKSVIKNIKQDVECANSLYYGLEEKFVSNFGRAPKKMTEVKTAAWLSNCTQNEVIDDLDMKVVN